MFFLKKLISAFLAPLSLVVVALLAGLFLLARTQRRRLGVALAAAGAGGLLLGGLELTSHLFLAPLERSHPAVLVAGVTHPREAEVRRARYVVVLGGGHVSDAAWPALSQLSAAAVARVAEGVRLWRQLPGAKLVFTGGVVVDPVAHAEVAARAAVDLGVPREAILALAEARDTEEEAAVLAARIGREPFLLVSSASHLPRAAGLMRKRGLDPIPAPTDLRARDIPGPDLDDFVPSGGNWSDLERAWHELFGSLWSRLRGKL